MYYNVYVRRTRLKIVFLKKKKKELPVLTHKLPAVIDVAAHNHLPARNANHNVPAFG